MKSNKDKCVHDKLTPSITGELHCHDCATKWRSFSAINVLLGRVRHLEERIETIEQYQMDHFHQGLSLLLNSCDRCQIYFPKEFNPYGVEYRQSPGDIKHCCICRDCLSDAYEDESCTWWDDDSEFAKQQVAEWYVKFYGSEKPSLMRTPDKYEFTQMGQHAIYQLIHTHIA